MAPRKPGGGGGASTPPPALALPPSPTAPPAAGVIEGEGAAHSGETGLLASGRGASGAPEAQHMSRETARRRSPFELWPREALIDVLLERNIELRHEADLSHEHLAQICTRYFADKPLPALPPPRPRDRERLRRMETAAVTIQRAWIQHAAAKRQRRMLARQASDPTCLEGGILPPPGAAAALAGAQQPLSCPTTAQAARELELPWLAPDVELAKEYADFNHPRKGGPGGSPFPLYSTTLGRYCVLGGCGEQLDLWDEGQVSELSIYGPGLTNYFKALKWQAWTTFCLFLLYLPQLLLNAFGDGAPVPTNGSFESLGKSTLGNLMRTLQAQNGVVEIPLCERLTSAYFPESVRCTIDRPRLAMLYTYLDVAACILLFLSFAWMKYFQKLEARILDRHAVTASDFTVKVTGLPPAGVSEAALRAHFARVLEVPVADVAVAFDDGALIEQHKLRGALLRRRDYVVNRIRYVTMLQATPGATGPVGRWFLQRELPKLKAENVRLLTRISALDALLGAKHARTKPLAAFVTFDHQDAFVHALAVYKSASWLCMDPALRFKGHRLRLEPAPEPSLILWENLGVGRPQRWGRKVLTGVVAGCMIAASVIFYFVVRYNQDENRVLKAVCPDGWAGLSPQAQRQQASDNHSYLGCYCSPRPLHAQHADALCKIYLEKQSRALGWTVFGSLLVVGVNWGITLWLGRMTAFGKAHSLDRQKLEVFLQTFFFKFINTGAVILLLGSREVQGWLRALGLPISTAGNFTSQWYFSSGLSLLFVMIANIGVPLLSLPFYWRARWTMRQAERGRLTGLITQEKMNDVFMGPEFPVATRAATTLVVFFVAVIYGQAMPLLLLFAAVTASVAYWTDKHLFLRYYRVPPRFGRKLSRGVANTTQFALLLHLLVSIWAYAQDELFPAPDPSAPSPSTPIIRSVTRVVDRFTRWTGPKLHPYLVRPHIAPLVLTLVVLAALLAGRHVLLACFHALRACVRCLSCRRGPPGVGAFARDPFGTADIFGGELNIIDVSYTRAVERGLITGLHTYNILVNPRYQAAFAISDRFAERHRHLESLRGHLALPFDDDEGSGGSGGEEDDDAELPPAASYDVEAPPSRPSSPPGRFFGGGGGGGGGGGRSSPAGQRAVVISTPPPSAPPME